MRGQKLFGALTLLGALAGCTLNVPNGALDNLVKVNSGAIGTAATDKGASGNATVTAPQGSVTVENGKTTVVGENGTVTTGDGKTTATRPQKGSGTVTDGTSATITVPEKTPAPAPAPTAQPGSSTVDVAQDNGNNSFDSAMHVELGQSVAVKQDTGKDTYYTVNIPGGHDGVLKVTVSEDNSSWGPYLYLYNDQKINKQSGGAADGTQANTVLQAPVSAAKAYFIKLDSANLENSPANLKFEFIPESDTHEPNDDWGSATEVTLGTPFEFQMFAGYDTLTGSDEDYLKFDMPAGKSILRVKITNNSSSLRTDYVDEPQEIDFRVFDENKVDVGSGSTNGVNANLDTTVEDLTPGMHYIKLKANANGLKLHQITLSAE